MLLYDLIKFNKQCKHEKVTLDVECAYCPDCGKFIHNEWYLTRCSCCGIKLKTIITNDTIRPINHYCSNCGAEEYEIEKLPKINFIDINFAVLRKRVKNDNLSKTPATCQCWQEKTLELPKLPIKSL